MASAATVLRALHGLANGVLQEAASAGFQELEIEMAEMQERTPVATGALKSTGFVNPPEIGRHEATVTLGFGGPAIGYAIYVHENPDAFHPVGQAFFMTSVLDESAPHLAKRISRRMALQRVVG